jgi:YVTN family beta-propeller protein
VRATVPVGDGPHEVAVTPDGRTAVVCNYGAQIPGSTLTVIDLATAKVVRTIDLRAEDGAPEGLEPRRIGRPHGIVFLSDGKRVLVTSEQSRHLLEVDIERGRITAAIATDQDASHMVALTPDGTTAFVANIRSGSVSAVDVGKRALRKVIPTGDGAEGIAVHPTRPECWVTNRSADTVSIIDTDELAVVAELDSAVFPIRVAFTPDGRHALVSNAQSGTVGVFDVAARQRIHEIAMDGQVAEAEGEDRMFAGQFDGSPVPVGILVAPDGKRAFVANTQADLITVIDCAKWTIERRLRAGKEPDGMAYAQARPGKGT